MAGILADISASMARSQTLSIFIRNPRAPSSSLARLMVAKADICRCSLAFGHRWAAVLIRRERKLKIV
jgi:hypothetical protein